MYSHLSLEKLNLCALYISHSIHLLYREYLSFSIPLLTRLSFQIPNQKHANPVLFFILQWSVYSSLPHSCFISHCYEDTNVEEKIIIKLILKLGCENDVWIEILHNTNDEKCHDQLRKFYLLRWLSLDLTNIYGPV